MLDTLTPLLPGFGPSMGEDLALRGVVRGVRVLRGDFRAYTVEVESDGRSVHETWVGETQAAYPGQAVRGVGKYEQHQTYGKQFRLSMLELVIDPSPRGMSSYLGSGVIDGIGPKFADAIVATFGEDTFNVLDLSPGRLQEVDGIGPERAKRIADGWAKHRAIARVMAFLHGHGIRPSIASSVVKRYGPERAVHVVESEPHRLALDVRGIGWKIADELAQRVGIAVDSPLRTMAATAHALADVATRGHTYVDRAELERRTLALLDRPASAIKDIREAIGSLAERGSCVVENAEDGQRLDDMPLLFGQEDRVIVISKSAFDAEWSVAQRIATLGASSGRGRGDTATRLRGFAAKGIASFEEASGFKLAPEQRDAIMGAADHPVLVVTGGPGTGKSTLTKGIIETWVAANYRILLAAPTGRAAKRLTDATTRKGVKPAMTIHRLLEWNPKGRCFGRDAACPLECDAILVDEASMIDADLASSLFAAIPDGARVVIVGDVDQLPSIRAGAFLRDVIASDTVPTVRLARIYRQGDGSAISAAAAAINSGKIPEGADDPSGEFFLIDRSSPEQAAETILTMVANRIPSRFGLDPIRDIAVLTPMHDGMCGTKELNARLQRELNPNGIELSRGEKRYRVGDKVMQLRNDYDRGVFNGDVGFVTSIDKAKAEIVVDIDGRPVLYDDEDMGDLTLAYASSVHKLQGGQAPAVVVYIGWEHAHMLTRRLFYTAVTRGERLVVVVAAPRAIARAVRELERENRRTRLESRLRALCSSHA